MVAVDETQLVALRRKDPVAYRELLQELGDSLYHVAFRILKDAAKAEEVVQEVFFKALKSIDQFEGRSSLKTWLYRITVNEALMAQRKELPHLETPLEELMPRYETPQSSTALPHWAQNPEKMASDHEFQLFYQECLATLPEILRTAYVLKDEEGLSEEEISQILGVTKSAVKNRAHRARLMLRNLIGARYGD